MFVCLLFGRLLFTFAFLDVLVDWSIVLGCFELGFVSLFCLMHFVWWLRMLLTTVLFAWCVYLLLCGFVVFALGGIVYFVVDFGLWYLGLVLGLLFYVC